MHLLTLHRLESPICSNLFGTVLRKNNGYTVGSGVITIQCVRNILYSSSPKKDDLSNKSLMHHTLRSTDSVDAISRTPPYTGKGCLEIIHEKGHHQMLEIRNLQRLVHVQFNTPTIRNAFLRSKCISYFFLLCVFLCVS